VSSARLITDVVVPARDCAAELGPVIAALPTRLFRSLVVVDNRSSDTTAQVARDAGAVVLHETRGGYGAACRRAVSHLEALPRPPDVVAFVAGNGSDDPNDLAALLRPIGDNAELVIGVRHTVRALPARTRVSLGLIGLIYGHRFADLGPFRAIRFPALVALGLTDMGAGWQVEMQVKALKLGLHIVEVPVGSQHPDRGALVRASVRQTGRELFQILRHATAR
jgi:glycosyltransferase involved in cell wall biosynthesis